MPCPTLVQAVRNVATALAASCQQAFVHQLDLQFAPDKTQLIVSHKELGPPLLRALGKYMGTLSLTANRLEADYSLTAAPPRAKLHQQAKRLKAHTARFRRLRRLFKGRTAPYLHAVGAKPVTTREWEFGAPAPSDLTKLANQAVTATRWSVPGIPHAVIQARTPLTWTPYWDAVWTPLSRLAHEAWLLHSHSRPPDALRYHGLVRVWCLCESLG
jgi:hypothetical protein